MRDVDRLAAGLITEPSLQFDLPSHQLRIDTTLATIKPRLLALDPLVGLHRGDENSSSEITALLSFLREPQRCHDVAIVLIQHVRKAASG